MPCSKKKKSRQTHLSNQNVSAYTLIPLPKMGNKRKRGAKESANGVPLSQKRAKTEAKTDVSAPAKKAAVDNKKYLLDKEPFPEQLTTTQERLREGALYNFLGSEDDTERLDAANTIISALLDGEGVSESVLDRHLEKRLFRGLASGRNASRLGFSIVLTEIIQQLFGEKDLSSSRYRGLTFDFVLNTLMEKTKPVGNISGQEERDHYFGQLFGIECFVRANVVFQEQERWEAIMNCLLKVAKKKVSMRSQCVWVIIQAVTQMKKKVAEQTLQKIADAGLAKSPEAVGLWIVVLDKFRDLQVPAKTWRDPLASKSLQDLASVLKDSGRSEDNAVDGAPKHKQGSWSAQLHFVWDIILAHFIKSSLKGDGTSDQFKLFWTRVVDQGFFSKGAADVQKFSGFMIFQKFLEGGASQPFVIDNLFSKNLMICLMNQAAKEDRYLHRAATKALKAIETVVEKNPDLVLPVLQELLGDNGAYNFDERTRSKTIEKILQHTQAKHGKLVIDAIRRLVLLTPEAEHAESHGRVYGEYLFKLTSVPSEELQPGETQEASVAGQALLEFAHSSYSSDDSLPALTENTKSMLRGRFMAALSKFVKKPEDFPDFCNAILSIDINSVEMDEELQSELVEALEKLQSLMKPPKKSKKTDESRGPNQGLALLYAVAILQLYNEEPDALEVLGDLKQCYASLSSKQKSDAETSSILVEVLLSLVARPSSLLRQSSLRVFEAFTSLMTAESLQLLTDTLNAEESAKGQQALFQTEDEMEGIEEGEGSDDEDLDGSDIDSDVEFVGMADANGAEEEGENEDDENDSDDGEDEEGEDDQNLKELDDALAKVLQSHRLDKDKDADSSDNDSDMSDSEMMELDDKLTEVFKQRVKKMNKKKDNKDAKETVINFKHRVLDFLAIYVEKEATNALAFSLLVPLLQCMQATQNKAIASKACEVIISFSQALRKVRSRKDPIGGLKKNEFLELLQEIHAEVPKDLSHAHAKAASTANLIVISSLFYQDESSFPSISSLYAETVAKWVQEKTAFQHSFLAEWNSWMLSQCQSPTAG